MRLCVDTYFRRERHVGAKHHVWGVQAIRTKYLSIDTFTPEHARKASPAAEGMCKWVHAMSSYDKVIKVVTPKRAALAEAEAAYEVVMVGLRAKQYELQELMMKLAGMEAELRSNTAKKERLEADIALCSVKLERAEKLLGGLGGEQARWTAAAAQLRADARHVIGDALLSAAVMAYLGPFTPVFRRALMRFYSSVTLIKA